MNEISLILRQVVKISEIDPLIVEPIIRQLVKISEIDPLIVESIIRQLAKISVIKTINVVELITQITKVLEKISNVRERLIDSISDGQIYSKNWIIEELNGKALGNVFICAGWFSTLLFDNRLRFEKCVSIDIDPQCEQISKILHKKYLIDNWKFQAVTKNIHEINYSGHSFNITKSDGTLANMFVIPDTIINTSCEHIENFTNWYDSIPEGKFLILQTNNGFDIPDHINCVQSLMNFDKQTPMKNLIYEGEKNLPKFTRYMRIGYK
jgi:hypothetical protein